MKFSAPIYHLKRNARRMAQKEAIRLHDALDRIAAEEGYKSWSLLADKYASAARAAKLYAKLRAGDLILIGARPGHGKTVMALELAVEAAKSGNRGVFFSLEWTENEVAERLRSMNFEAIQSGGLFEFDGSDAICAEYIIKKMGSAPRGTTIVIDYLQLLDQKRENPPLAEQVSALKTFANERGLVIIFSSQIDRSYDSSKKPQPDLQDIRLPNPMDLSLFSKTCFLHNGIIEFNTAR